MPLHARTTRTIRFGAVAAAGIAAVAVCAAPAAWAADRTDAPASAASAPAAKVQAVDSPDQAAAFWTPERMAAARPFGSASGSGSADPVAASAATTISVAQQVAPVPHIGRLYFTNGGVSFWCSANVVQATNGSTISTAAHCLSLDGVSTHDLAFTPAYEDGTGPYGVWPIVAESITAGWEGNNADQAADAAFVITKPDASGRTLQSVVGGSPVAFDRPYDETGSVYGYPAAGRFDGQTLQRCVGRVAFYFSTQFQMDCDMNGGVSGGPVFEGDGPDGAQFAVEDARPTTGSRVIGPMWQSRVHAAYDSAEAADPGMFG
ncbi:serine protease [Clavibacter sp. VKM Ac-2873]|uniref:trypsin-like serine peptidase n=1 Tax=Clavibacter sp. VKM Ac-2873 TaxID=2783813 RepID=UPI001889CEAF|nr:serine protease [Clavibacter sp. VKM Ac-2873]MBF4619351.1 serine protease [Clavibacter sp. VKM Ac-2873]